jgi:hypothetical protein
MNGFIQRHTAAVRGRLNGFDRLRLRGTKRVLASRGGMMSFPGQAIRYLVSSSRSKEALVRGALCGESPSDRGEQPRMTQRGHRSQTKLR